MNVLNLLVFFIFGFIVIRLDRVLSEKFGDNGRNWGLIFYSIYFTSFCFWIERRFFKNFDNEYLKFLIVFSIVALILIVLEMLNKLINKIISEKKNIDSDAR